MRSLSTDEKPGGVADLSLLTTGTTLFSEDGDLVDDSSCAERGLSISPLLLVKEGLESSKFSGLLMTDGHGDSGMLISPEEILSRSSFTGLSGPRDEAGEVILSSEGLL